MTEGQKRDLVLKQLAESRSYLVGRGYDVAIKIVKVAGTVSSTDVWKELRDLALHDDELRISLDEADPRWMGAVFNRKCWERVKWVSEGSHKRPVAVWRLHPLLPGISP
jgi:hypothetical protein